jgi:hypothetical protein
MRLSADMSQSPSHLPTDGPSIGPTDEPVVAESSRPLGKTTTAKTSLSTSLPSDSPSSFPLVARTSPSDIPTSLPTLGPSVLPSALPSSFPTLGTSYSLTTLPKTSQPVPCRHSYLTPNINTYNHRWYITERVGTNRFPVYRDGSRSLFASNTFALYKSQGRLKHDRGHRVKC